MDSRCSSAVLSRRVCTTKPWNHWWACCLLSTHESFVKGFSSAGWDIHVSWSVCVSAWVLTRVAQIVTAADLLMNSGHKPETGQSHLFYWSKSLWKKDLVWIVVFNPAELHSLWTACSIIRLCSRATMRPSLIKWPLKKPLESDILRATKPTMWK